MAAVDRVGIEVEVLGYEGAISKMRSLERAMKGLGGRKAVIQAEARLKKLNENLKGLRSQKVKIQIDANNVDKKLRYVQKRINELQNKKMRLRLDGASAEELKKVDREILRCREAITKLQGQKINIQSNLGKVNQEMRETEAEAGRLRQVLAQVKSMSLGQVFSKITSGTAHFGSALQSAGNALTRLTNPFSNLMRGTLFASGYAVLGMAQRGLDRATERADIMSTYVPIMKALGQDGERAKTAIENLNQAVIGLPTGLDEIVEQHKLLTMAIGDVTQAEKLAIAANNAYIAGGADESKVTMAKKELQTLAQVGKLNERQWMTLQKGIPTAWNEIQKKMKEAGKIEGSLLEGLKEGKVTAKEFMDALSVEGISGVTADVTNEMKHTFAAATSNIENAFARMGQKVVGTLDEVLKSATGKDTVDTLISLSGAIDKMSAGIQNWIKANPDKILDFLNAIKNFDWKGLGQGLLDGIDMLISFGTKAAEFFGGNGKIINPKNIGRFIIFGNIFGKALTVVGGLIKGSRHLVGGIGTGLVGLGRLMTGFGAAKAGGALLKFVDFFKNFGKAKTAAKAAETAAETAAKSSTIIKSSLTTMIKALSGIGTVAGGVLIIGGTVFATIKMIKSIVKDLGTISADMSKVDPDAMKQLGKWMAIIGGGLASLGAVTGLTGGGLAVAAGLEAGILAVGTLITTMTGFAWLNSSIIKKTLGNASKAVSSIQTIVSGLNGLKGASIDVAGVKGLLSDLGQLIPEMQITYQGAYHEKNLKPKDAEDMASIFTYTATMFKGLKDAVSAIKGMGKIPDMKGVADRITPLIDGLGHVFGAMNTSFKGYKIDSGRAKDYGKIMTNVKSMFTTIYQISKQVPKLQAELANTVGTQPGRGATPFTMLTNTLKSFFTGLGEVYLSMKDNFIWANGGAVGNNTSMYTSAIQNAYAMFQAVGNIAKMIPTLKQQLSSIMGSAGSGGLYGGLGSGLPSGGKSPFDAVAGQMKAMFQGLGEVVESLDTEIPDTSGLVDKMNNLVSAVNKIKEAASTLNTLGSGDLASADGAVFTAINNIQTMITRLQTSLNVEAIGAIAQQVAIFKLAVQNLLTSIQEIGAKPIDIKFTFTATVNYDNVLNKLDSARARIEAAAERAARPIHKTVSITITPSVSVGSFSMPSFFRTGGAVHRARGGAIYRAKGGGTPFKKRGTDTVPAMLSPGEFVQRKEAVDTFGIDFMRKVNNLDIAGAMRALSARAGANSAMARGTVINHNVTNNNNQKVTQNINTNNPNFAFRRSNRYVGALV